MMTELAALITAGTALLVALGGGIKFLWDKVEKRFREIEAGLESCTRERGVQLTVIELLWSDLLRHAPESIVLQRAKKLLDELKSKGD